MGAAVGRAGFRLSDDRQHRELGYLLTPAVWGRGLATELARALVEWHFGHIDAGIGPELHAWTFVEHSASRRVLEKTGFEFVDERLRDGRVQALYSRHPSSER